jgi:hypothetical protein
MIRFSQQNLSGAAFLISAACLLFAVSGCATWFPTQPAVKSGIAETDETLKTPLRPATSGADDKLPWWDMRNILDPRSRDIERHLGV